MCAKLPRCSKLAIHRAPCVVRIAFGLPVVPDVKLIRPRASAGTFGSDNRSPGSSGTSSTVITSQPRLAKLEACARVVTTSFAPESPIEYSRSASLIDAFSGVSPAPAMRSPVVAHTAGMELRNDVATGSPGCIPRSSSICATRPARPASSRKLISFTPSDTAMPSPNSLAIAARSFAQGMLVSIRLQPPPDCAARRCP